MDKIYIETNLSLAIQRCKKLEERGIEVERIVSIRLCIEDALFEFLKEKE